MKTTTTPVPKSFFLFVLLLSVTPALSFAQDIIFYDNFESENLNAGAWTVQQSENGGFVSIVSELDNLESIAHTGRQALAIGRSSDGNEATVNMVDLSLDLSDQSEVTLLFYIRDQGDETDEGEEGDIIRLSSDGGGTFQTALQLYPGKWTNGAYGHVALDLAGAARRLGLELTDQFVVRFQQRGEDNFSGVRTSADGFLIDDVKVIAGQTYAALPFEDGFEADSLGPAWRVADAYNGGTVDGTQGTALESEAQWSIAEPVQELGGLESVAHTGRYALAMGRSGDGNAPTVSALDLHLDLSGQSEVTLQFYVRDQGDETDPEDALYFSADGGRTFKRALGLDPESQTNGVYERATFDVDSAAAALDLALTDQFVVRFQQRGEDNFSGVRTSADGFLIDSLVVSASTPIPIEDGAIPDAFRLDQNYPNPFNPATTIPFTLERPGKVRLSVFDVLGREVAVLIDGQRGVGAQEIIFKAADLPSGVYLYRLETEERVEIRQMTLLK